MPVAIGSNAIFSPSVDTSDFVMVSFIFPKTFFPRQSLTSRFGCDRLLNSVYLNKQPTFGSWDGRSAVDLLNGPLSRQNSVKALVSTWFLSVRVCVFAVPWGSELTRFTAPPSRYLGSAGDSKFTRWATLRSGPCCRHSLCSPQLSRAHANKDIEPGNDILPHVTARRRAFECAFRNT